MQIGCIQSYCELWMRAQPARLAALITVDFCAGITRTLLYSKTKTPDCLEQQNND